MTNKEIYSKTISFSVFRLLYDILAFALLAALTVGGFFITEATMENGLIGLGIGALVGIVLLAILLRYISYTFKAGQIAMMTEAVTTGELPEDVVGAGKKAVKDRFATVAIFFAATGVVRGIFNELGKAISGVGKAVGGDTGETIGSVINSAISVVVSYLCDCCLGWIFYRSGVNAAKATCEGAVLFFKHGKTLARNLGRVFGMGLASLVAIGGVFSGIFYLVAAQFPAFFNELAGIIAEDASGNVAVFLSDPTHLAIAAAVLGGVIVWSIIHGAFVRPFVLTGVLRNYLESGMADVPSEAAFSMLDGKSKKFAELHAQVA
ncbi:MAG: hypothetical protein Q4D39_08160 [Coriobacteriaceae bacterium]|nr:hypothetical protein [Coriobacteriaceae bacterium]